MTYQDWFSDADRTIRGYIATAEFPPDDECFYLDANAPTRVKVIAGVSDNRPVVTLLNLRNFVAARQNRMSTRFVFDNNETTSDVMKRVYGPNFAAQFGSIRPNYMQTMYVAKLTNRTKRWISLHEASKDINRYVKMHARLEPLRVQPIAQQQQQPVAGSSSSTLNKCVICTVEDTDPGLRVAPCNSWMHCECIANLFDNSLKNLTVPKCPCSFMNTTNKEEHEILRTRELDAILTQDQIGRWKRALNKRRIDPEDLIRTCPSCKKTQSGVVPGARTYYCSNPQCTTQGSWGICTRCNVEIVSDPSAHNCNSSENDKLFLEYCRRNRSITMPCPGCHHAVEKERADQCNHMKCKQCDIKYCAVCAHQFPIRNGSYVYTHTCKTNNSYHMGNRKTILEAINNALV